MNQDIFTFPFGQIGEALRALSLASSAGNIAAMIIYLLISILPVLYLVDRVARQKKEPDAIDILLIMMSVMLFIMMYLMVNPGYVNSNLYGAMPGKGGALAMTFWSMVVGYAVLKCMKASVGTDEKKLAKYLKLILTAVAVTIVAEIVLGIFTEVVPAARGVREVDQLLNSDYNTTVFLWIKYFADKIPSVLNIFVIVHAIKMVDQPAGRQVQPGDHFCSGKIEPDLPYLRHRDDNNFHRCKSVSISDLDKSIQSELCSRYSSLFHRYVYRCPPSVKVHCIRQGLKGR